VLLALLVLLVPLVLLALLDQLDQLEIKALMVTQVVILDQLDLEVLGLQA
jgi:hypothetical protein